MPRSSKVHRKAKASRGAEVAKARSVLFGSKGLCCYLETARLTHGHLQGCGGATKNVVLARAVEHVKALKEGNDALKAELHALEASTV